MTGSAVIWRVSPWSTRVSGCASASDWPSSAYPLRRSGVVWRRCCDSSPMLGRRRWRAFCSLSFSFAFFPGWVRNFLEILALFAVVEAALTSFLEPVFYGRTTGITAHRTARCRHVLDVALGIAGAAALDTAHRLPGGSGQVCARVCGSSPLASQRGTLS